MDLSKIEAIKTVFVTQNFTGQNVVNWTANIYVPFSPDFMITKSIIYNPENTDIDLNTDIFCDILGQPIGQIAVGSVGSTAEYNNLIFSYSPNLMFKLPAGKTINGAVSFRNQSPTSGNTHPLNGILSIALEFIKVKAEKPQLVY